MEENCIELNDIKYEVKSLIEFSSLAKLLFDLSKRQKEMEQNILLINSLINDKDNRLLNLEKKVLGNIQQEKNISGSNKNPVITKNEINFESQNREKNFGNQKNDIDTKVEKLDNDNNYNININEDNNNEYYKNIDENNNYNENNENKENHLEKNNNNDIGKGGDKTEKENEKINTEDNNIISNSSKNNDLEAENLLEKNENNINNDNNKENIFDGKIEIKEFKLEPEMISKLFRKVNELEKKINIINAKTTKDISPKIQTNLDNINNINGQLEKYGQNFEDVTKKFVQFQEEFDKIKVKIEDFNIYDIFKNETGQGGNIDINTALIQALEKKIFKKFELYDEKNKKNEEDLFKNSENIKNFKGLIDNMKNLIQKNSDKIKENENSFNDFKNKINENLTQLKNFVELLQQQLPKDASKSNSEEKIKQIEEKLNIYILL